MSLREVTPTGIEALRLATALLQRLRLADPVAGVFEAADVQWSWRTPRISDYAQKTFWLDDDGPVAGILLTSTSETNWQIDPVIVPGVSAPEPCRVWSRMMDHLNVRPEVVFDIPVSDDDPAFTDLAKKSGFTPTSTDSTGWMSAASAPTPSEIAVGFELVDRVQRQGTSHPMSDRNGAHVEERLLECSLYDPSLDLSIRTLNGEVAGYALLWCDPVTNVGLIEPVRVHDDFQRRGLARAMVTHGIERLVTAGAQRVKVSWETAAAGALYTSVGFQRQSTTTWYSSAPNESPTVRSIHEK